MGKILFRKMFVSIENLTISLDFFQCLEKNTHLLTTFFDSEYVDYLVKSCFPQLLEIL